MRLIIIAAALALVLSYMAKATVAAMDAYDRISRAYSAADSLATRTDIKQGLESLKTSSLNEGQR